tara:strand:+ start:71 stop:976 length:906 start_codon:yes stop_codon:yes gene_type:complete
MPKNAGKFICECCDFSCSKKSNYDKHLITRKHLIRTNTKNNTNSEKMLDTEEKNIYEDKIHVCICGKEYKHAGSLWNHKKKCTVIDVEVVETNEKEDQKDKIIIEMAKQLEENKMVAEKLMEKVDELTDTVKNQPPTTTNIVNNFNLNVFLNETCKDAINLTDFVESIQLQLKDLENMGKLGYVEGMSNIIITELNNLEKEKRPIHCSDVKRDVLYIKDNDTWEKDDTKVKEAVKNLEKKNFKQMGNWLQENPSAAYGQSSKSTEYHNIIQGSFSQDEDKKIKKVIKNIAKAVPVRDKDNN